MRRFKPVHVIDRMTSKPSTHVLPELRFPNRLEKVRRVGVEIARAEGQFGRPVGGRLIKAEFDGFRISYFTPLNQPTDWPGIDWKDRRIQLSLHGLVISRGLRGCLSIFWDEHDRYIRWFRNPTTDNWDKRIRQAWDSRHG